MKKTTLYFDEKELKDIKILAIKLAKGSASDLIRQAVGDFIRRNKQRPPFSFLKKHLLKKPRATSFPDAVSYQKSLRKDWD